MCGGRGMDHSALAMSAPDMATSCLPRVSRAHQRRHVEVERFTRVAGVGGARERPRAARARPAVWSVRSPRRRCDVASAPVTPRAARPSTPCVRSEIPTPVSRRFPVSKCAPPVAHRKMPMIGRSIEGRVDRFIRNTTKATDPHVVGHPPHRPRVACLDECRERRGHHLVVAAGVEHQREPWLLRRTRAQPARASPRGRRGRSQNTTYPSTTVVLAGGVFSSDGNSTRLVFRVTNGGAHVGKRVDLRVCRRPTARRHAVWIRKTTQRRDGFVPHENRVDSRRPQASAGVASASARTPPPCQTHAPRPTAGTGGLRPDHR